MVERRDEESQGFDGRNLLDLVDNFRASLVTQLERLDPSAETLSAISTAVTALRSDVEAFNAELQDLPTAVIELSRRVWELEIRVTEALVGVAASQQQAKTASRKAWRFLCEIGRELRDPLAAVLNLADLLKGQDLAVEQRIVVADLVRTGAELFDLLEDALLLSRLEAGLLPMSPGLIEPAGPVGDACQVIRPLADDHGVVITVDGGDHPAVRLRADRRYLTHSVATLLRFAVTSSRPGDRVRIGWIGDADALLLWIRDSGHGFPTGTLASLFDPDGKRLSGASAGTRLRLVLARRLVEAMQGTIHVESEPGRGSTFTLRLCRSGRPDS